MYTLNELLELKDRWLSEAIKDGQIETLFLVVRQMGTQINDRGKPAYLLEFGTVHAIYQERPGPWLTQEKRFDQIKAIIVRVGAGHWWMGKVACHFATGATVNQSDNIFVPGDWINPFLNLREQANQKLQQTILMEQEAKRLTLLKELWINE